MYSVLVHAGVCVSVCVCTLNGSVRQDLAQYKYLLFGVLVLGMSGWVPGMSGWVPGMF